MVNFLQETLKHLQAHQQSPTTVLWVGSANGATAGTWNDFTKLADFDYDNGYSGQRIANDLVIVYSDDHWSSRGEYDGSEWWEYNEKPLIKPDHKRLESVRSNYSMYSDSF